MIASIYRTGNAATRDHVEAKSRSVVQTTREWACRACNELKANHPLPVWECFIKKTACWWKLWDAPEDRRQASKWLLGLTAAWDAAAPSKKFEAIQQYLAVSPPLNQMDWQPRRPPAVS